MPRPWGLNGFNVTDLAVNPFAEGDVWLADANNLWHSLDSGITWTKLTAMATVGGAEGNNVHGAIKVALGAPAPAVSYSAALYLVVTINGKDAVYRSNDMGANWVRIDDAHRYGGVSRIVADSNLCGRVFISGRGPDYNY